MSRESLIEACYPRSSKNIPLKRSPECSPPQRLLSYRNGVLQQIDYFSLIRLVLAFPPVRTGEIIGDHSLVNMPRSFLREFVSSFVVKPGSSDTNNHFFSFDVLCQVFMTQAKSHLGYRRVAFVEQIVRKNRSKILSSPFTACLPLLARPSCSGKISQLLGNQTSRPFQKGN